MFKQRSANMIEAKLEKLNAALKEPGSLIVAFSGGVDSSFLLYMAHKLRKSSVVAVTIRTSYMPEREISEAIEFTGRYGIRHEIIDIDFPEIIRNNPVDRCYLCKKTLFATVLRYAADHNCRYVADGTNSDDEGTFRPGMVALRELGIKSPLLESGLTKSEIRELSESEGLETWDKPAMACLLTRIPYDTRVTATSLTMIEKAESLLFDSGFQGTRVRIHGDIARIECLPACMERMVRDPEREYIISSFKEIGFRYVSLDLEGYRTGSSDPVSDNRSSPEG